ncbi:MAG TPA: ATP-binding protein [Burkholderiales bacterium]|nr:ATP-binding protein [Burkholderiales bacterium]
MAEIETERESLERELAAARADAADARRNLAEAERRVAQLDAVLDAMPHAVYIGDAYGIWRANTEALHMLGASSLDDLNDNIGNLGAKFRVRRQREGDVVPPEQLPFSRALGGTPAHLDTWATRLDTGEDVYIGGHSAPVRLEGETIGAVAVNVDLTQRVVIEEQLRAADRRKDDFLAMLAHELRNPLAPIRNAAHILRLDPEGSERVRQAAAIIARQVDHMTDLVDDLLDVSRVTRGLVTLDKQVVDAREVIAAAVEQTAGLVQTRRHRVEIRAPEPAFVCGDRTRLVQIITNLLANAAKFTSEGGLIRVDVSGDERCVALTVADNGSGIRAELLPHVFEPFTQEERPVDRSQGGLGLGLALVRSLVELHQGKVTVSSEGPGRGAEFTVSLPRYSESGAPAGARAASSRGDAVPRGALDVLVVDDNADAADSLAAVLRADGHHVHVEHGAKAALEYAAASPPRVLLLDIGLPDMDGYELARRMRALAPTRGALLVALTGYGQAGDRERSQAAGFDFHLVKPADPARITELLADLA